MKEIDDWQPIETAPRFSRALVCGGERNITDGYHDVQAAWIDSHGNVWADDRKDGSAPLQPTHWQPAPRAAHRPVKLADSKPWETVVTYGRADLRLHILVREAYKVACLIEDCGGSEALTTASSAAFALSELLSDHFRGMFSYEYHVLQILGNGQISPSRARELIVELRQGGNPQMPPLILTEIEAMSNGGWLPIESAPKDETPVIVGFDAASEWIVHKAFYRDGTSGWNGEETLPVEDIGWWSYTKGSVSQEKLDGYRTPTHWLPMPTVPGHVKRPA